LEAEDRDKERSGASMQEISKTARTPVKITARILFMFASYSKNRDEVTSTASK
jgi:hypothetical protein